MLTLVTLLAAVSAAPSFDCRNAETAVERAICASPELSTLDTRLAVVFGALQDKAVFSSGNAELMEQRLWLRRRVERCPSEVGLSTCLESLYRARLAQLQDAGNVEPYARRLLTAHGNYPDTSAQDLQICRAVALTVERNSLVRPRSSPFLDSASWRDGGSDVGLGTDDEGTMHGRSPLVATNGVTTTLDGGFSKPGESEDWFMTARWFIYAGRPFIVRYPDWSDIYPEYVGALTDDLSERPVCRLDVKVDVRLTPLRPADAGICRTAWNGGGRTIAPVTSGRTPDVLGRDAPGGSTQIDASALVDAMNDGRPIHMYRYNVDSGAGAGCDLSYYDTAPDDALSEAHKAWTVAQGLDLTDAYARRTCFDDKPIWKRIDGKTYLLSQSKGARDPTWDRQEFLTVNTVERGAPRRVCTGDFSRRTVTISYTWRGTGWAPFTR